MEHTARAALAAYLAATIPARPAAPAPAALIRPACLVDAIDRAACRVAADR